MEDTIYLTISKKGVQSMKKSFVGSKKGEVIVKLLVEVEDQAFTPPVIEKYVQINDWRSDVDIQDVKFDEHFITEEEAKIIKDKRLEKMRSILEEQGFEITKPEEEKL